MNKSEIASEFRKLKHVLVWSFGDKRRLRSGAKNFLDNVILHECGELWFIEIKMDYTGDKFTPGQLLTRELLRKTEQMTNGIVKYRLVNEFNYQTIVG